MKDLEIHHGIMIKNEENNDVKWRELKIFSAHYLSILYFNKQQFFKYIINGSFVNIKTIVIFNERNISSVKNSLKEFKKVSKSI